MIYGISKALHANPPSPFNQSAKIDNRVRTKFEIGTALAQKLDVMVSPCPLADSYDQDGSTLARAYNSDEPEWLVLVVQCLVAKEARKRELP